MQRAGEQARAAIFGARWEDSSPDEDGVATGGAELMTILIHGTKNVMRNLEDDPYTKQKLSDL